MAKKIRNIKEINPELFNGKNEVQWDYEKNEKEGIKPEEVSLSNSDKVYFYGRTCKHKFEKTFREVLRKDREINCPYCTGKQILIGFNDLKSVCPKFFNNTDSIQWDYDKNNEENLYPENFTKSSHKKVWVKCNNGHSWKANISNVFDKEKGCPYCSHKIPIIGETDLKTKFPEIAKEWDYDKNYPYRPEDFLFASNKKVHWIKTIKKYNKIWKLEWEDIISVRTLQDAGCPYLTNKKLLIGFNDFKSWCIYNNRVDLLEEWDYNKNTLKPEECLDGGSKNIWWKRILIKNDKKFEISWKTKIYNRKNGVGDPYSCVPARKILKGYNDIESNYPELMKEWNYNKNKKNPSEYLKDSNQKVWWKCSVCGYEWNTLITTRTRGCNCPNCSKSKGEKKVRDFLIKENISFIPQMQLNGCNFIFPLKFDFGIIFNNIPILMIEYQGEQHFKPVDFAGKGEKWAKEQFQLNLKRDKIKREYCKKNNIPLLEIPYTEFNNIEKILTDKLKEVGL